MEEAAGCEDPTEISKAAANEDGGVKRSSRLFDALRSSLNKVDRHSFLLSSNNHLFIVHKEVENFEEEAMTLLSNVMNKHLVDGTVESCTQTHEISEDDVIRNDTTVDSMNNTEEFDITLLDDSTGPSTSL